jgi:hypothetical protein
MQLSEKEDQLISVQKSLDLERDEKMSLLDEKTRDEEEWMKEKTQLQAEKQEITQKLAEALEENKSDKNAKLKEAETNEINQAYHKVIKDKESLENENGLLKQEVKRLQMIISSPNEIDHLRSSSMYGNAEDFGYSSNTNTLEKRKQASPTHLSEGSEFYSLQHSSNQSSNTSSTFERKLKSFFGFANNSRIEGKKKFISYLSNTNRMCEGNKLITKMLIKRGDFL